MGKRSCGDGGKCHWGFGEMIKEEKYIIEAEHNTLHFMPVHHGQVPT